MPGAGRVALVAFGAAAVAVAVACQPQPTPSSQVSVAPSPGPTPLVTPTPEPAPTPLPSGVAAAFPITLTDPEGKYPLDVTLLDRTGLVASVDTFIREDVREGLAEAADGGPGLEYVWETGACALRTTLTLERSDVFEDSSRDTFRLTNVLDEEGQSCLLLGVLRPIVIRLMEPIAARQVHVVEGAVTSYRLMFDGVTRPFPTEFELLDRTGVVTGLAHPTNLGSQGGLADAIEPDVGLWYWPVAGMCTYRIAMLFDTAESNNEYRLSVSFDTKWLDGCAMNAAGRWVLIQLPTSIRAKDVELVETPDP